MPFLCNNIGIRAASSYIDCRGLDIEHYVLVADVGSVRREIDSRLVIHLHECACICVWAFRQSDDFIAIICVCFFLLADQLQCWIDLGAPWRWQIYMSLVSAVLFVCPAIIIAACYAIIIRTIWTNGALLMDNGMCDSIEKGRNKNRTMRYDGLFFTFIWQIEVVEEPVPGVLFQEPKLKPLKWLLSLL